MTSYQGLPPRQLCSLDIQPTQAPASAGLGDNWLGS
jgi:hypothetical protein